MWIHKIGRKHLPLNNVSCVCSDHFENARGRLLRQDEYSTLNLPCLTTKVRQRKPPAKRLIVDSKSNDSDSGEELVDDDDEPRTIELGVQTVESSSNLSDLQVKIAELQEKKIALSTPSIGSRERLLPQGLLVLLVISLPQ